jgi:hypothetical protein
MNCVASSIVQGRFRLAGQAAARRPAMHNASQHASFPTMISPKIPAMSPEASGPIFHIVDGLLLGVGQSRKHPRRRFPGDFALFVQVPHGVTRFFEFSKNLGDQLGSGAACGVIFDPLIFNIDPKPKNLGDAEFHSCALGRTRQIVAALKLA